MNSLFATVARRVAVCFDPVTATADRISIGVLSLGGDFYGGLLALQLAVDAVKANKCTMLIEARPEPRILARAWNLDRKRSVISPVGDISAEPQVPVPISASMLLAASIASREAVDVTPERVRVILSEFGNQRDVNVVNFSAPDIGAMSSWICGLDAFVIVIRQGRTRRRVVEELLGLTEIRDKCIGAVLS